MSEPPLEQHDPIDTADEPQLDPALLAAAAPRTAVAHQHITHDCPCTTCGYNLRGLPYDAHCPECNVATAASLRGRWLYYMSPRWVKRLGLGATFLGLSVTAVPVAFAFLAPISLWLIGDFTYLLVLWILFFTAGILFVTTSPPQVSNGLTPWQIPAWLSAFVIGPSLFLALAIDQNVIKLPIALPSEFLQTSLALLPLCLIPLLLHLRSLINLVPKPTLPWSYRGAIISLLVATLAVTFSILLVPLLSDSLQHFFRLFFACLGTLVIIVAYLFPVACLVVAMIDLRRAALYAPVAAKYLTANFND